jgi:hypothetical protein
MGNEEIIVVFNRSDNPQSVKLPIKNGVNFEDILSGENKSFNGVDNGTEINLEPLTAIVLKKR